MFNPLDGQQSDKMTLWVRAWAQKAGYQGLHPDSTACQCVPQDKILNFSGSISR